MLYLRDLPVFVPFPIIFLSLGLHGSLYTREEIKKFFMQAALGVCKLHALCKRLFETLVWPLGSLRACCVAASATSKRRRRIHAELHRWRKAKADRIVQHLAVALAVVLPVLAAALAVVGAPILSSMKLLMSS
eukprot:TRINITY_DN16821_c0_g1_i1.p2 TRINITY_DN16821_c0_g1~~TRINITY_DN16821_c0_g1_i1.p2  ORF type:complete len:133 (-),score=13.89 TRINITY_DN16821_c0_g1_i1:136-534(-)